MPNPNPSKVAVNDTAEARCSTTLAPTVCLACRSRACSVGLVCAPCSDAIATSGTLLPQQIAATMTDGGDAALLDQWGRAHMLATNTQIGRTVATSGIAIIDSSVSRCHALVVRTQGVWRVVDTGSSNGTRVNSAAVGERALDHGDRIHFGAVGFVIVFDIGPIARVPDPPIITSVCLSTETARRASTQPYDEGELVTTPFRILEPSGGGGGFLELADGTAQLSPTQLELLDILSRRMRDDAQRPLPVRGFVRSSELVGALSWDTHSPDETHVKQLVRRLRRTLVRSGLGDLIESRHGLGYRLRVIPTELPTGPSGEQQTR